MTSYRLLITGSRTWTDREAIARALDKAVVNPHQWKVILVHGGARGVDTMAAELAKEHGWSVEKHNAHWYEHDDKCPGWHEGERICKRAGHRRNEHMVSLGADLCLAFIKDQSTGATGCAKAAEAANIPVIRFEQ